LLLAFVLANDFKIVPPEAPQSLDVITHPESCLSPVAEGLIATISELAM
jgi:hypothetical protein